MHAGRTTANGFAGWVFLSSDTQQRASWGSAANRLNPIWATNAFLNKMIDVYPNDAWMGAPIGEVCQRVQISAFPGRYQPEAGDAQKIVDAVWNYAGDHTQASFSGDARTDLMVLTVGGVIGVRLNNGSGFNGPLDVSGSWGNFLGHPGQGLLYFA